MADREVRAFRFEASRPLEIILRDGTTACSVNHRGDVDISLGALGRVSRHHVVDFVAKKSPDDLTTVTFSYVTPLGHQRTLVVAETIYHLSAHAWVARANKACGV